MHLARALFPPQIKAGDLIRVGDPWTGDTFRVLAGVGTFTNVFLPLATPENPLVPATYNNTDLVLYPAYVVGWGGGVMHMNFD